MGSQSARSKMKWLLVPALLLVVVASAIGILVYRDNHPEIEVIALVDVLELKPGMRVAEVGAGEGYFTVALGQRLGPTGQLFSTELDEDQVRDLEKTVEDAGLDNVRIVQAGERQTNLPAECCDAIFTRKVYHHFTDPRSMNASLFEALRPGGQLAVIDFPPDLWHAWLSRPKGVPENRGGHGMPLEILIEEATDAGFRLEQRLEDWSVWPLGRYCVVFRKP